MGRLNNRGTTQIAPIERATQFSLTQKVTGKATATSLLRLKSYTTDICIPAFTCPGSLENKPTCCLFFTAFIYIFNIF